MVLDEDPGLVINSREKKIRGVQGENLKEPGWELSSSKWSEEQDNSRPSRMAGQTLSRYILPQ